MQQKYEKKLEEQKKSTYVVNESKRGRDVRLWKLFEEHVDHVNRKIHWRQIPNILKQTNSRFNPKRYYWYLSTLRKYVFWTLIQQLRNLIARIGVENFWGTINYRWPITQWFSIILRVARRVKLTRSVGQDCWIIDTINCSGRNQIIVAGKHYHTASMMACLVQDRPVESDDEEYMWTTSHHCHNCLRVRPNHLCWERHDENIERSGCVYVSAASCIHDPSCLWVDRKGRFLSCRND
ncbi:hypothetical protein M3Y96_00658000 [Aphelenchoides besseyi]|nr:hypothetical protein M3Y96_00658000 [Aphelenchoides besseyi]